MNDLKGINDNYGHEKGDISIQTVCNIACQVFNPMSVYRVGGDEFIVILEDGEFENREELVTKVKELFKQNESNDSLSPWERVSAAVGYAVYDPNSDEHVAGVMQRADAEMYENKKEMKANKK
ncbi:MAG: GGDEF domain-containing protein [Clostridiales bacterium]|nr:GGDEF domain-containing protein [Clostridiales bacterium]